MNGTAGTWLVVNASSGSNNEDAVREVGAALDAGGWRPDRIVDALSDGLPSPADLQAQRVDRMAIFTGDGTLNSILTGVEGWDGQVLVLPGGTANLLARSLHGEAEAFEIARIVSCMRPVRRNCIRTAQGSALIELLAGPGAKWSDVREEMREGTIGTIADTAVDAVKHSTAGSMVRMIFPDLGRDEGYVGIRLEPTAAGIEISGYGPQGVGDYLLQGLALLQRDFRQGPHDKLGTHPEITCCSVDGAPIDFMIDGERATGSAEETFSLAPLAVNLLSGGDV